MATITSSGISGLDVNGLVSQLVAAERGPHDTRIARVEQKLTTEFSALAQLKGAMTVFQSALSGLKDADDFTVRNTTVGDKEAFSATASAKAAAGRYDVEVAQLARAAQLGSAAVPGGAQAVLGAGTLTVGVGTNAFTVNLTAESTLADLRDAINDAPGNTGVQATLITDVAGTHLVLSGEETGAENAVRVTSAGGNPLLDAFVHDPPTTSNMTVLSAAQDAIVRVSGYEIRSPGNRIEDAIEGVTLVLAKANPGTQVPFTISNDQAAIRTKVDEFLKAYNSLATTMKKLRAYDPETKAAGPLIGDAMLRNIESQLRRMISDPVAGAAPGHTTLAAIGITSSLDGTLTLDSARFDAAVAADRTAVSRLFASEEGLAVQLDRFFEQRLSEGGELAARDDRIEARTKDLVKQKEALETRMELIQTRYKKQFSALDAMLTQMQSTSSYLAKQLASISSGS